MVRRLAEKPNKLIAVFGPRQTGKTTIVRQVLRQIDLEKRYLAVDSPDSRVPPLPSNVSGATMPLPQVRDTDWLVRNWREGRHEANRSGRGFVLVFDEIQKIANWSETVKGLWDADRSRNCPLHVVILGSAPLLMQSGLRESLAGRFELDSCYALVLPGNVSGFRLRPASISLFRGLPRSCPVRSRPGPLA